MNKTIPRIIIIGVSIIAFNSCKKNKCLKEKAIPAYCNTIDFDPDYYDPVCGCDGVMYNSSIVAECVAGVTEYNQGACK